MYRVTLFFSVYTSFNQCAIIYSLYRSTIILNLSQEDINKNTNETRLNNKKKI